MVKGKQAMRQAILSSLYEQLQENYTVVYPRETFIKGNLSLHELDALLAFKSEPRLVELRNAIDRLEHGTFGVCIHCKGGISQHLLVSDPARRVCPQCERELSHQAVSRLDSNAML